SAAARSYYLLVAAISACLSARLFFFFQAEDGIRDRNVTGVQTCALPILSLPRGSGPTVRAENCSSSTRAEGKTGTGPAGRATFEVMTDHTGSPAVRASPVTVKRCASSALAAPQA